MAEKDIDNGALPRYGELISGNDLRILLKIDRIKDIELKLFPDSVQDLDVASNRGPVNI